MNDSQDRYRGYLTYIIPNGDAFTGWLFSMFSNNNEYDSSVMFNAEIGNIYDRPTSMFDAAIHEASKRGFKIDSEWSQMGNGLVAWFVLSEDDMRVDVCESEKCAGRCLPNGTYRDDIVLPVLSVKRGGMFNSTYKTVDEREEMIKPENNDVYTAFLSRDERSDCVYLTVRSMNSNVGFIDTPINYANNKRGYRIAEYHDFDERSAASVVLAKHGFVVQDGFKDDTGDGPEESYASVLYSESLAKSTASTRNSHNVSGDDSCPECGYNYMKVAEDFAKSLTNRGTEFLVTLSGTFVMLESDEDGPEEGYSILVYIAAERSKAPRSPIAVKMLDDSGAWVPHRLTSSEHYHLTNELHRWLSVRRALVSTGRGFSVWW